MNNEKEKVERVAKKLISRLEKKQERTEEEELILRVNKSFPNDIGLFSIFLLNYLKLKKGEAIFLAANEPHAYLYGINRLTSFYF